MPNLLILMDRSIRPIDDQYYGHGRFTLSDNFPSESEERVDEGTKDKEDGTKVGLR